MSKRQRNDNENARDVEEVPTRVLPHRADDDCANGADAARDADKAAADRAGVVDDGAAAGMGRANDRVDVDSADGTAAADASPQGVPRDPFATACELAAIASEDHRDRQRALAALAKPAADSTAVLTEATRSGGTQALPASLRAAMPAAVGEAAPDDAARASSAAPVSSDADAPSGGELAAGLLARLRALLATRRGRLLAAAGAAACVVAVAALAMLGGVLFRPVNEGMVRSALEADASFMRGFASDEYVEPSDYRLSDVHVASTRAEQDGSIAAEATATLKNASFESACEVSLLFAPVSRASDYPELRDAPTVGGGMVGAVVGKSAETRAIAPVNADADAPKGFAPVFDEAEQTCVYDDERDFDLWFATSTVETTYRYEFDGSGWTRTVTGPRHAFACKAGAIEGAYELSDGSGGRVDSFKITNFDEETGTCSVEYRLVAPGIAAPTVSGVISCTVTAREPTDATGGYRQADGMVYELSGTGASSGGAGTARIDAVFSLDGALAVTLDADYTRPPFIIGEPVDETMEIAGTLQRAA